MLDGWDKNRGNCEINGSAEVNFFRNSIDVIKQSIIELYGFAVV
jgi:hypothetical protein